MHAFVLENQHAGASTPNLLRSSEEIGLDVASALSDAAHDRSGNSRNSRITRNPDDYSRK